MVLPPFSDPGSPKNIEQYRHDSEGGSGGGGGYSQSLDPELASFAQNIVTLESILFRASQELASPDVSVDRLNLFISDMYSIHQELKDQQGRAVAARGVNADDVVRLQGLLSGPLMEVVSGAERHIAEAQAKIDALSSFVAGGGAPPSPPVDGPPPKGDDGGMEPRVKKLEDFVDGAREEFRTIDVRLTKIETRLDGIATTIATSMATKGDLAAMESTLVKWLVVTAIAMIGTTFAVAKFFH